MSWCNLTVSVRGGALQGKTTMFKKIEESVDSTVTTLKVSRGPAAAAPYG